MNTPIHWIVATLFLLGSSTAEVFGQVDCAAPGNLRGIPWGRLAMPLDRWQPNEDADPIEAATTGTLNTNVREAMGRR